MWLYEGVAEDGCGGVSRSNEALAPDDARQEDAISCSIIGPSASDQIKRAYLSASICKGKSY
jgi:hypothetical protein